MIGRRGCQDDQVDVARVQPGIFERGAGRRGGDIGGQFAVGGNVTLPDAGTLADPVVAGVDLQGKFFIGHDALGKIGAAAPDHGSHYCHDATELACEPAEERRSL